MSVASRMLAGLSGSPSVESMSRSAMLSCTRTLPSLVTTIGAVMPMSPPAVALRGSVKSPKSALRSMVSVATVISCWSSRKLLAVSDSSKPWPSSTTRIWYVPAGTSPVTSVSMSSSSAAPGASVADCPGTLPTVTLAGSSESPLGERRAVAPTRPDRLVLPPLVTASDTEPPASWPAMMSVGTWTRINSPWRSTNGSSMVSVPAAAATLLVSLDSATWSAASMRTSST